jgi:hypothetical protein
MEVSTNERNNEDYLLIYPNPSSGTFRVSVPDGDVDRYRLIDFAGKVIMERNWTNDREQTFHLDHLPAGVYFLQLNTGERLMVKKVIIH